MCGMITQTDPGVVFEEVLGQSCCQRTSFADVDTIMVFLTFTEGFREVYMCA